MRTIRNASLAVMLLVAAIVAPHTVFATATAATWPQCEDGCTCTVDPWGSAFATVECEEVAPVDECPYAFDSCVEFCEENFPAWWNNMYSPPADPIECMFDELEGCNPASLEPPTSITCSCLCFQ